MGKEGAANSRARPIWTNVRADGIDQSGASFMSGKLRLLHVIPTYLPAVRYGGPIHSVHGLCRALAESGHEVHVATTSVDGAGDSDVAYGREVDLDGVRIRYFRSARLRSLYWSAGLAAHLWRVAGSFDLVHLHSVFLSPTTVAAAAARKASVPYIMSPRGALSPDLIAGRRPWIKRLWIELFERRNLADAAALHFTSDHERRKFLELGLPQRHLFCIPNAIDLPPAAPPCTRDPRQVMFLGRLHPIKGLDRLIAAMSEIPDAELIIAGPDENGYQSVLEAQAHKAGVSDRIRFVGPLYGSSKWMCFAQASVFVLPSYSENFGSVVLEAMSCATPVIVTPEVGCSDIVRGAGAGVVVDGEPSVLASAIRQLLENPRVAESMGNAGRLIVHDRYTWSQVAQAMISAYVTVLRAAEAPAA